MTQLSPYSIFSPEPQWIPTNKTALFKSPKKPKKQPLPTSYSVQDPARKRKFTPLVKTDVLSEEPESKKSRKNLAKEQISSLEELAKFSDHLYLTLGNPQEEIEMPLLPTNRTVCVRVNDISQISLPLLFPNMGTLIYSRSGDTIHFYCESGHVTYQNVKITRILHPEELKEVTDDLFMHKLAKKLSSKFTDHAMIYIERSNHKVDYS